MAIRNIKASELTPDPSNANRGTERGRALLEQSLRTYGAGRSILVDKHGRIIAGNKTLETAAEIGLDDVVVVQTDGRQVVAVQRMDLDLAQDEEARMMAYADNRVGQIDLDFDPAQLLADINAGFPLDQFWQQDELDALMAELMPPATTGDTPPQIDKAAELQAKWNTQTGQLWALGEHRLIVGDCTDRATVERVLGGEKARYGIQDPPYGISVVGGSKAFGSVGGSKAFGSVGGSNIVQANRYAPIVDDDKPYDPTYILSVCHDSVLWGANYYADKLPPKKGWIVWDKKGKDWDDNFSDCELAWTPFDVVTKIYRHVWMGIIQEGKRETRQHPTQKPSGLYEKIISDLFVDDGVIVDFYLGSGTTLIACENLSRRCRAVEISPAYCAVAIERWAQHTGQTPRLVT